MELHTEIKNDLHRIIEEVQDEHILQAVYTILRREAENEASTVVGYDVQGSPIIRADLRKKVDEAEKRVNSGHFTSQEDLEKEATTW